MGKEGRKGGGKRGGKKTGMEAEKEGAREEGHTTIFIPVKSGYSEHQRATQMVQIENSKKANMNGGGRGREDSCPHLPG